MDLRFIVTGHGRSGTKWLARLLNDATTDVIVHHEPLVQFDAAHYARVYSGALDPREFVAERERRMQAIWARFPNRGYAEVNGYLRYCVPELRDHFNVHVVAIVRDGRFVARSLLARGCYQRPGYPPIRPPVTLAPFAACCWYWADTYRRLVGQGVPIWRLEDLNEDFGVYVNLCQALDFEADHYTWEQHAGKRLNVSIKDEELPAWGADECEAFEGLAGDVQDRFGYEAPIAMEG